MFLTMALIGLQIWELQGVLLFVSIVIVVQILVSVAFAISVVFFVMDRDYESVVMPAGFSGTSIDSTATAIVNMAAVTKEHDPAHRAFIIVPLACGFFIDLVNALVINVFVGL